MQAIILVGGFATRLRPLTDHRPKALLPILNKPMILHLIEKVRGLVDNVVLAVNYGKEHLGQYFSENDCGVTITLNPEDEPLGTGGAIKNAEKHINDTFIVFNGDVITSLDIEQFIAFHGNKKGICSLALWKVSDPSRFGIISIDNNNQITRFLEKPKPDEVFSHLINAGTYCLEPEVLDLIPSGRKVSIEREIYPNILDRRLFGLEFKGYWFDAGTPEIYLETHKKMLDDLYGHSSLNDNLGSNTIISPNAKLRPPVLLGNNCSIDDNSVLGPYVCLGNNIKIGSSCRLENVVIHNGTQVQDQVIAKDVILGEENIVGTGVKLPDGLVTGDGYKVDEAYLKKYFE